MTTHAWDPSYLGGSSSTKSALPSTIAQAKTPPLTHPPARGRRCRLHTQLWLWMGFYCPRELRNPLRYPFSHLDRSGANTPRIPDLSRPARWPNAGFLSPIESRVLGTHTKDGCFSYRLHTTTPSPWPILRRPSPMLRRRTMSQMQD